MEKNNTNLPHTPTRASLPAYEQVKHAVREYIRSSGLRPGDRIPTEAQLCDQFGWSRPTINRALNELEWEGVLERVQGSGTYVATPRPRNRPYRIMVSSRVPAESTDPYFSLLFAGIREAAAAREVDIRYYYQEPVPCAEVTQRLEVDALLAAAWHLDDVPRVLRLSQTGVPVVGVGLRSRACALPSVCTDNFGGVCEAIRYLVDAGHRRIAFATANLYTSDVCERLLAFHHAMAQAGQAVNPAHLWLACGETDALCLEHWWESLTPPPTALVLADYFLTPLVRLFERKGVRIPDDVSLVVIDNIRGTSPSWPLMTTIRQPVYQLGHRSLSKLIEMLQSEDDGSPEVLPTELVIGETVAPPKEAAMPIHSAALSVRV
jgi:GntR family transcriptional regulator, arabinose operon transcriptional repressor